MQGSQVHLDSGKKTLVLASSWEEGSWVSASAPGLAWDPQASSWT